MIRTRRQAGFTLLEVLVATLIMSIAVVGLMSNLTASLGNTSKLTEHDRATMLARQKMDELLIASKLPRYQPLEGQFDPAVSGGLEAGWKSQVILLDAPPGSGPGMPCVDMIQLQVWWKADGRVKTFVLEAPRRSTLELGDMERAGLGAAR